MLTETGPSRTSMGDVTGMYLMWVLGCSLPASAASHTASDTHVPIYILRWGKPIPATPSVCPPFPEHPLVEMLAWKSQEEMGPYFLMKGLAAD